MSNDRHGEADDDPSEATDGPRGETADRSGDADTIRAHYDDLADVYRDVVETPLREHRTWPTTRSLLGDVAGDRVLDAGCGPGHYAAELAADGADVVGIDASEAMVERARSEFGDGCSFQTAAIGEALPFEDETFDAVVCQLVLSHVPDLEAAFEQFARVLVPEGRLVLATHHPFHDYLVTRDGEYPDVEGWGTELDPAVEADDPTYAETERFQIDWSGKAEGVPGTYYRRPLSELVSQLLAAGFDLTELREPVPDEAFLEGYPDVADDLASLPPELLCLRGDIPDA